MMEIYIKTRREVITEIGYTITDSACPPVKACASIATKLALGKPVLEAYLVNEGQIAEEAGGLEGEYRHCAIMAELTLKRAITDYAKRSHGTGPA